MRTPALVGRDGELAQVVRVLAAARAGHGQLVLLAGEPGIGKSTLARGAADLASDYRIGWGRCWEQGGAPAFWPWIQVLRAVRRELPELPVPEEVCRLLPELGATAGPVDRFLLFDAVQRYLADAARDRPLLAIVEDLHAADLPSLALLELVATQLASARLVFIGTYRTTEVRAGAETAGHLDRIARDAERITLSPLGRAHVAELSGELPPDAVDAIHRASGGNPLFVRELLGLTERGARLIPDTLRAAIREHFRGLPASALGLASCCAVVGHELSRGLLAELVGRDPEADIAVLLSHGILVAPASGRLGFSHGLYAEVMHDDLAAEERERLHRTAGTLLEHVGAPAAEIARHWFAGGSTTVARAVEVARRAADEATRQLAYEDAAQLLERALAIAPSGEVNTRFELLVALAAVQIQAGDGAAGKRTAGDAMSAARLLGTGEAMGRAALAYGATFHVGVTDPTLVAWIEESLAALPDGDLPLRARLLARRASALQPADDSQGPISLAREAIAMARRLDDEQTLLEVLHAATSALVNFASPDETREVNRQALELALRRRDLGIALRARYRLILDHIRLGDPSGVARELRLYEALAAEVKRPDAVATAAQVRALLALHQGRLDDYRAEAAASSRLGIAAIGFRVMSAIALGDDDAMRADRKALLDMLAPNHPVYYATCAPFLHARAGEIEQARAALTRVSAQAVATFGDAVTLGWLVEAVWIVGDRERAAVLLADLPRLGDQWGGTGQPALSLEPPMSRLCGLLAACLGDRDRARDELGAALAALRASDLPVLLARTLVDWADTAPSIATQDEATAALAEAHAISTRLGLPLVSRIAARGAPGARLTLARDGDTWRIAGPGGEVRIKHGRGVELLARLVAEPTRELHVLDLVGAENADVGDAGEIADHTAIAAYRKRVLELREELEHAGDWPEERRARAEAELETLEAELRSVVGIGGRARRTTGAAERARVNVQRRLADVIKHIAGLVPDLGAHLTACVRTGTACSYDPRRAP